MIVHDTMFSSSCKIISGPFRALSEIKLEPRCLLSKEWKGQCLHLSTSLPTRDHDFCLEQFLTSSKFVKDSLKSRIMRDETEYLEHKRLLRQSTEYLAENLDKYDMDTVMAIFLLSVDISEDYRCDKLNTRLIETLISESKKSCGFNTRFGVEPYNSKILKYVSNDNVNNIKAEGAHLIYMLGSFHYFRLEALLKEHFDFFSVSINSYLLKYSLNHLLLLSEYTAKLYRYERCAILFQRCITAVCDSVEQGGISLSTDQYVNILQWLGNFGNNNSFLNKWLNNLISSSITNDCLKDFGQLCLSDVIRERYVIAKSHLDLLHTFLLTGLFDKETIIESLLGSIMNFCLFYFTSTSKICKPNYVEDIARNYDIIDPKVSALLYSKYPNKVFRCQPMETDDRKRAECSDVRFFMINAALSRLLFDGKSSFCRKLKRCEVYIRAFNPLIHKNLPKDLQRFMTSVLLHKYKDQDLYSEYDEGLYTFLKKLNYKPYKLMVDGVFPINCLDYKRKIFIEILEKHNVYSERMLDLKLQYLYSLGWNSITVSHSDWINSQEESRIRLLQEKIKSIST